MKVGSSLTLEQEQDGEIIRYRCRVVDQKGQNLYIDYPINLTTGRTDLFPKGARLFAYFVSDDEAVYQFHTEVKGRKKDNVPLLVLHYDKDKLKKIQRREYVRVDAGLDIAVQSVDETCEPFATVTKDISGGGVALLYPFERYLPQATALDVIIVIHSEQEEQGYIFAKMETIRTQEKSEVAKPILSMKFTEIDEKDRQRIIQFCFDKQLQERRRQYSTKS
ncbi:c-di-GMP-binding flagellar brake protein YcgR, contains PilZNR and PilZ domains [Pelagirhabdus alkalitolerans]|uniref:C-di-GMP-binding flagellar brake protein YcgR, contains PilZNR and PilZ domains n=1 Tax=Pelagirhabdus alkalitolerans TaxID=1612202 RepID=A0A1G6HBB8_9BACI|nr:flagellar brake domain-containing protein [Pelagirhabdus alkalitolerans]SDB91453.1 c-di-GMP-binding flagellar brake protein YcgR, contains PilZNR and PilZ domains [Pelagirhabdus alkalitolerans]